MLTATAPAPGLGPVAHAHKLEHAHVLFEGWDIAPGRVKWKGSRVDLLFGANLQLHHHRKSTCRDSERGFVDDFVAAGAKVMHLDRFDLPAPVAACDARARPRAKL